MSLIVLAQPDLSVAKFRAALAKKPLLDVEVMRNVPVKLLVLVANVPILVLWPILVDSMPFARFSILYRSEQ